MTDTIQKEYNDELDEDFEKTLEKKLSHSDPDEVAKLLIHLIILKVLKIQQNHQLLMDHNLMKNSNNYKKK